ncbi:hypothetical protein D3C73_1012490 [compost metagenome]
MVRFEQPAPIMSIPGGQQGRVTHAHHHAGFIELGQRGLRAVALSCGQAIDVPALLRIECALDRQVACPDQGIEQVVPVFGTRCDAAFGDARFIVQAVGQQRRILFNKALVRQRQARVQIGHARPFHCGQQISEFGDTGKHRMIERSPIHCRAQRCHEAAGAAISSLRPGHSTLRSNAGRVVGGSASP